MRSGLLATVKMEREFSVALQEGIPCIHSVKALFLEEQTVQSSRWIKFSENLVENGLGMLMTCYRGTAIISVMSSLKGLVCQRFQASCPILVFLIYAWNPWLNLVVVTDLVDGSDVLCNIWHISRIILLWLWQNSTRSHCVGNLMYK